jgi:hypothetical protein
MFYKLLLCVFIFFLFYKCANKKPQVTLSNVEQAQKILADQRAEQEKNAVKLKKAALKRNLKMQSKPVRKSLKRNKKKLKKRMKKINR